MVFVFVSAKIYLSGFNIQLNEFNVPFEVHLIRQ